MSVSCVLSPTTRKQEFGNLIAAVTPIELSEKRVHALFEEALSLDKGEDACSDKFSPEAFSILCSKHGITPTTSVSEPELQPSASGRHSGTNLGAKTRSRRDRK